MHKAGYTTSTILSLGEFKLNWVNKLRYVGGYFVNNPNRLFDVKNQITKFYGSVHSILTYCSVNRELVLLKLLEPKYAPILFYRLDAIFFMLKSEKYLVKLAWNWALPAVFRIKSRESTRQLLNYCNLLPASNLK